MERKYFKYLKILHDFFNCEKKMTMLTINTIIKEIKDVPIKRLEELYQLSEFLRGNPKVIERVDEHELQLITNNTDHFNRIDGLDIANWIR